MNDLQSQLKNQVESGMTTVNIASIPFRALNVVVSGLIHLAASSHPVAQKAIGEIGGMIHDNWHNSAIGKGWGNTRVSIINEFKKLDILESDTSYFLDSVEELALAGGTAGVGSIAKAALKTAKKFTAYIKRNDFPVIDDIYFKSTTWSEYIKRPVALGKVGKGYIQYHYVKGSQNSVLIYLDYIQKGQHEYAYVPSSLSMGEPAYSTSKAAIKEMKEIAEKLGSSDRVFLQFEPENPKFHAFIEKNYASKGWHTVKDTFGVRGIRGPYPVFELTAPLAAETTTSKIVKLMSPFAASETLRVLANGSYLSQDQICFSLISPAKASESISEISFSEADTSENSLAAPFNDLSDSNDVLATIHQNLIEFGGEATGVTPAMEELNRLHEIIVVLTKNPEQGSIKIVSELLKTPQAMVKNLLQSPQNFLCKGDLFLKDPLANCMGALAACGSLLTFMKSVTWICDFIRDPKDMVKSTLKMPFTTVKGVIDLGIGLIRHPEKTAISFCKSLIKAPVHTVKGFLRAIGLKKRKKRKAPPQSPSINPQEKKRLFKKYLTDLTALYGCAKINWFIDPFKTIEEYHSDLQKDWELRSECRTLCKDFLNFPSYLQAKFEQRDFDSIKRFTPRAHPKETIAPIEVVLAYEEVNKSLAKVQMTSQLLNAATQVKIATIQELNVERARLHNNINQLSTFLDNNEDKIKQALRARMNKNKQ